MSIQYSDTTNKRGILQFIERELFDSNYGYITGNTTRLAEWTAEINLTHDNVHHIIFEAGGTWQFDDSNHDSFPFIKTNLVSGQRDYTFTADEDGNLVLDIYRVMVADSSGVFREINPVDKQTPNSDTKTLIDGQDSGGTPTRYDKTANGILLDLIPNYNYTNGLKVFINREGFYFTTADTTKKPGIAGLYHEYYVVDPAYRYAARKRHAAKDDLLQRKLVLEEKIRDHYAFRQRDVKERLIANVENTR